MIYNSNQIAEIIGVNVSTIKRWTASGKLDCHQTAGGHRKFHLNHIRKFIKKNNKSSININFKHLIGDNKPIVAAIEMNDTKTLVDYSYKSLISINSDNFIALNNALILSGYPIENIYDNIILPILEKIGNQWAEGKLSITEEHLATEEIRKFLVNLNYDAAPDGANLNAFCFTLKNDSHDLPLYMGELVFNQNNIKAFNLGANLPVDDFINLSKKVSPDIIFVSLIYIKDLQEINKEINLLCKSFLNSNTKIFFRGASLEKITLNYKNYIQINSFKSLKKNIL